MLSLNKLFWISLFVINFLVVILTLSFFYPKGMFTYFNSDTLYAPMIFRGLFIDGSGLEGWHFNAAPNFFPDFLGYSLVNMIIPNFKWAMIVFSGLQYAGLMALLTWLLIRVKQNIPFVFVIAANVFVLLFFGVAASGIDYYFTYQLISISYHLGPFILSVLSLIILSFYLQKSSNKKYYYLLLATIFLGVLNNRLYVVMFTLPTLLILILTYKKHTALVQRLLVGVILSNALGFLSFWGLRQSGYIRFVSTDWKMFNFQNIQHSLEVWVGQLSDFLFPLDLRGIIFLLSLVSWIIMLRYVVKSIRKIFFDGNDRLHFEDFYVLYFFLFIPVVLLVPVLNGAYVGPAIIRYNIHIYYFAVFNWGYILFKFFEQRIQTKERILNRISIFSIAILFTLLITGLYARRGNFKDFIQYKPGYVNCIDEFAAKYDAQYGTGSYWFSKTTTMFSDQDVRMYHLFSDFRAHYHSLNRNWFYNSEKGRYSNPDFRFIVTSDSASDSLNIRKLLGEPITVEPCNNLRILKYPSYKFDKESRLPYLAEDE